jgi:hypothetical protein
LMVRFQLKRYPARLLGKKSGPKAASRGEKRCLWIN